MLVGHNALRLATGSTTSSSTSYGSDLNSLYPSYIEVTGGKINLSKSNHQELQIIGVLHLWDQINFYYSLDTSSDTIPWVGVLFLPKDFSFFLGTIQNSLGTIPKQVSTLKETENNPKIA